MHIGRLGVLARGSVLVTGTQTPRPRDRIRQPGGQSSARFGTTGPCPTGPNPATAPTCPAKGRQRNLADDPGAAKDSGRFPEGDFKSLRRTR